MFIAVRIFLYPLLFRCLFHTRAEPTTGTFAGIVQMAIYKSTRHTSAVLCKLFGKTAAAAPSPKSGTVCEESFALVVFYNHYSRGQFVSTHLYSRMSNGRASLIAGFAPTVRPPEFSLPRRSQTTKA